MIHVIILCGGSGSRLWPLSTNKQPKQFLKLFNDKSLLQNTYNRVKDLGKVTLVTNVKFIDLIKEQLPNEKYNILTEMERRDTGPAITSAVCMCEDDETILIIPSDHYIKDVDSFHKTIRSGIKLSNSNIVTYGISPEYPETGYGYIEVDKNNTNNVIKFTEKPILSKAKEFLEKGNYYWNAGIFLFNSTIFKQEMKKYNEEMYDICLSSTNQNFNNKTQIYNLNNNFLKVDSISIDFALLEKTDKIKMIPSFFKWSDVGSWKSVHMLSDLNHNKNTNNMQGDSTSSLYYTNSKKNIVCIGLDNIGIIETDNNLLVMNLDNSTALKNFIKNVM